VVIPDAADDAFARQPHEQQVRQRIDDLGSVEGGVVVLQLSERTI
jgi:hypothetical protein